MARETSGLFGWTSFWYLGIANVRRRFPSLSLSLLKLLDSGADRRAPPTVPHLVLGGLPPHQGRRRLLPRAAPPCLVLPRPRRRARRRRKGRRIASRRPRPLALPRLLDTIDAPSLSSLPQYRRASPPSRPVSPRPTLLRPPLLVLVPDFSLPPSPPLPSLRVVYVFTLSPRSPLLPRPQAPSRMHVDPIPGPLASAPLVSSFRSCHEAGSSFLPGLPSLGFGLRTRPGPSECAMVDGRRKIAVRGKGGTTGQREQKRETARPGTTMGGRAGERGGPGVENETYRGGGRGGWGARPDQKRGLRERAVYLRGSSPTCVSERRLVEAGGGGGKTVGQKRERERRTWSRAGRPPCPSCGTAPSSSGPTPWSPP